MNIRLTVKTQDRKSQAFLVFETTPADLYTVHPGQQPFYFLTMLLTQAA